MERKETGICGWFAALPPIGLVSRPGPARDFIAMLVAAIGTGFLVSLSVAALALALAGSAQAATPAPKQREAQFNPAATTLAWIGDGCESLAMVPLERDWHVRISARGVTVRAMTTYRVPAEYDGAVLVSGALPRGARMQSLLLQGERREFAPQLLEAAAGVAPDLTTDANDMVAYASEPIIGLQAGEPFVVTLKFELRLHATERLAGLQFVGGLAQAESPVFDMPAAVPPTPSESIWIEWIANLPAAITGAPALADFETARGRIDAVNWSSSPVRPGPIRLVLAY